MNKKLIRVGVLVNSTQIPAWQAYLIEALTTSSSIAHVSILVPKDRAYCSAEHSFLLGLFEKYGGWPLGDSPDALAIVDLNLSSADELRPLDTFNGKDGRTHLNPRDEKEIAALALDTIVVLGPIDLLDTLSRVSLFGAMYFWHDYDLTSYIDGSLTGIVEVLRRRPFIRAQLRLRENTTGQDRQLYKSFSAINHSSHKTCRNQHLWKIAEFPARALKRMIEMDSILTHFDVCEKRYESPCNGEIRSRHLQTARLAVGLVRYSLSRIKDKLERHVFLERWTVFFNAAVTDTTGPHSHRTQPDQCQMLISPADRFWADPFPFHHNDKQYIFFEDASMLTGHGRLAVVQIDAAGIAASAEIILEETHHLSYPFIFNFEQELFLVPESADNNRVSLYRCDSFPGEWHFVTDLMQGISAYDATFIFHDDTWWMFVNIQSHPGASSWDELYLFYSDRPTSTDWHAHPLNPIVSDVRTARPAGKLFAKNGKLFRPSQNSSYRYGYGINIMEIVDLSTTSYKEVLCEAIHPENRVSVRGMHTLNYDRNFLVTDAIIREKRRA